MRSLPLRARRRAAPTRVQPLPRPFKPRLEQMEDRRAPGDLLGGLLIPALLEPGFSSLDQKHQDETASLGEVASLSVVDPLDQTALSLKGRTLTPRADAAAAPAVAEHSAVAPVNPWEQGTARPPFRTSASETAAGATLASLAQFSPGAAPVFRTETAAAGRAPYTGTRPLDLLFNFAGLAAPGTAPLATPAAGAAGCADVDEEQIAEAYGKLPLSFEANAGQTDARVEFVSRGHGYTLFLDDGEAVLRLRTPGKGGLAEAQAGPQAVLHMQLVGANPAPAAAGLQPLAGRANYYVGNDPSQWHDRIATFGRVEYDEVYPGVDVVYYGNQQQLEYDFVVAPGADPSPIGLRFAGADRLELAPEGDLLLHTAVGVVRQQAPYVYQDVGGMRQEIASSYELGAEGQVGFQLGDYDTTLPLVIDPIMIYSSYLGGAGLLDAGIGVDADPFGFAYVTGMTDGLGFPITPGVVQPGYMGGIDAFVTKITPPGTGIAWSTYLGGTGGDVGMGVKQTEHGWYVSVAGTTSSLDFPIWNAAMLQPLYGGGVSDAFNTLLDWNGTATFSGFSYSTFIGGRLEDTGDDTAVPCPLTQPIAPPPEGPRPNRPPDPWVTGMTRSAGTFPITPGVIQPVYGGGVSDAYLTRIGTTPGGAYPGFVFSTYHGGRLEDFGTGVDVDDLNFAYITGGTNSPTGAFPITPGVFQPAYGGGPYDAFVARFDPLGAVRPYSSYLGGQRTDIGWDMAVPCRPSPGAFFAHVTGETDSAGSFPLAGVLSAYGGGVSDAFVTKVIPTGAALMYSRYLGGMFDDIGYGIDVNAFGEAFVTGMTASPDFPSVMPMPGLIDAFWTKLTPIGAIMDSTFYGGPGLDIGLDIASEFMGPPAVMTGLTTGPIPIGPAAVFQPGYGGGVFDGFVAKLA